MNAASHSFNSSEEPERSLLASTPETLEERVVERTRLLMRAKRTWEVTFDSIHDPLAIINEDLAVVRTNLAHAGAAGVDVRRTAGRRCYEVLFGRDAACEGCPALRALAASAPAEAELADAQTGRVYRVSAFPMPTDDTSDAGARQVVCHYRDITGEKALQRKLLQSEKMAAVGTLAGGVAHEINNPLGAIQAFAQLALLDVPPGGPLHEYLTEIEQSTHRCQRIVRGLLDYSRPSRAERGPVSLSAVVDHAAFLLGTQYKRAAVKLVRIVSPDVPPVTGDANQLEQVALNLLSNAYQALEGRAGTITVTIEATEGVEVRLRVSDDGPGIDPRYVDTVFEPFFTTKPEGKGTGLGLTIIYGIVKDHGGTIGVESRPGEYTAFTVSLPWPGTASLPSTTSPTQHAGAHP